MVYALKLLLAVLAVTIMAAFVGRRAFSGLVTSQQYMRGWAIVAAAAVVSYLSRFPAVFMVGIGALGYVSMRMMGGDMKARLATFMLLIVALPPLVVSVEGIAGINRFTNFDHMRMLSLVLLVIPSFELLFRRRERESNPFRAMDICVLAYQALSIFTLAQGTFTFFLRMLFESWIGVLVPYYVTTRGLKTMADLRYVSTYFMIGCVFVAAVAALEIALQRNLYTPLQYIYGVQWQSSHTLMRGGLVRVQSTTPQPIILAFLLIAALGVWTWLIDGRWRRAGPLSVYALLLVALAATFSRGPWLGAALLFASMFALRWLSARIYGVALVALLLTAIGIKLAGADEAVMDVLKSLFGSAQEDIGSIQYRKLLLDTALALLKQSPVWGVPNYLDYMDNLKQGEGIIDLVNTYLIVALNGGLVGLVVFLLPQILVFWKLLSRLGRDARNGIQNLFVKVLISTLLALSVVLLTTSSFYIVPYLMLFLMAASVAYLRMGPDQLREVPIEEPKSTLGVAQYSVHY